MRLNSTLFGRVFAGFVARAFGFASQSCSSTSFSTSSKFFVDSYCVVFVNKMLMLRMMNATSCSHFFYSLVALPHSLALVAYAYAISARNFKSKIQVSVDFLSLQNKIFAILKFSRMLFST